MSAVEASAAAIVVTAYSWLGVLTVRRALSWRLFFTSSDDVQRGIQVLCVFVFWPVFWLTGALAAIGRWTR